MLTLITCEHAGNKIPEKFNKCFSSDNSILDTHEAYDIGAVKIFKKLSPLADFSLSTSVSRLLVEVNRSLHNKNLFSDFTKDLNSSQKDEILNKYYNPYRLAVEKFVCDNFNNKKLHLSIHTFTPILNNKKRTADIGILFNPDSDFEKRISHLLKKYFRKYFSGFIIKFNYPYSGRSDGFTTYLREKYSYKNYAGIELEINQRFFISNSNDKLLLSGIYNVIKNVLAESKIILSL